MSAETILLVDDDEVLSQVLRRVLTREGYAVVEAGTAAQALQLAHDRNITLGLFDLSLPDGDGMDLARQLRDQGVTFPVILMTAYPLRLSENPELAAGFTRVLTKPLNLQQVREAITAALASPARPRPPAPDPVPATAAVAAPPVVHREPERVALRPEPAHALPEGARPHRRWLPLVVGTLLTAAVGLAAVKYSHQIVEFIKPAPPAAAVNPSLGARSVPGDPNGLELSPEVVKQLRITTGPVRKADATRPLVLSGSINYDPDYLARARPRFQGEVTEIATDHGTGPGGQTEDRALTFGDKVKKGDLLAVVWCKDLGVQKGALADALNKQWADEDLLKRLEDLYKSGDGSLATVNGQRAVVRADRGAVLTAERTLETWKVTRDEIEQVRKEARQIYDLRQANDFEKSKQVGKDWPRVEVRAGISGTIVEKNVNLGDIVDPTASPDLFKIADLAHLAVWAHAYEEDLRLLRKLREDLHGPIPWKVETTDGGSEPEVKSDHIELISPSIDPYQHTALVLGRVDNGDGRLKIGQFVTATVQLPVPPNAVAVPTSALVEDGDESIVFIQPDPAAPRYSMRRVLVAKRLGNLAYVRTPLTPPEKERGYQELKVDELVVTQRALELKAGLEDLQEKAQGRKEAEGK